MRVWGILLLVGAGTMFGFYKAYGYRKRITDIIMLQNAFRLLETEIFYTLTPVPVAMAALEPKFLMHYSSFSSCLDCHGAGAAAGVSCLGAGHVVSGTGYLLRGRGIGRSAQLWLELGGRRFAGAAEKFSVIAAKAELCAGRSRTAAAAARKGLAVYGCLRQYGGCDYFVLGRTIDGN